MELAIELLGFESRDRLMLTAARRIWKREREMEDGVAVEKNTQFCL